MGVKFIAKIRERAGNITRYGLAKLLGVPPQTVDYLEEKGKNLTMSRLRQLRTIGKLSWQELGELIDREYAEKSEKKSGKPTG